MEDFILQIVAGVIVLAIGAFFFDKNKKNKEANININNQTNIDTQINNNYGLSNRNRNEEQQELNHIVNDVAKRLAIFAWIVIFIMIIIGILLANLS